MKQCTRCLQHKELGDFQKNPRYSQGVVSWCKVCKADYNRAKGYKNLNVASVSAAKNKYVAKNPDKVRSSKQKWAKANGKKVLANTRKYQAAKLNRTPEWLTTKQVKAIEEMYVACPQGQEVDHVIPLQGKQVSGLHVPWNLQYLPISSNRRKSNKVA